MNPSDSAELSTNVLPTWFGFAAELHARLFETAKKTLAERFPELPDQAGSVDDLEDYWSPEANPPITAAAPIENMAKNSADRLSECVEADIQPAHMDVPLVMAAARIAATFFSMRDVLPKMARPGSITVLETRDAQGIHELCSVIGRGLFPQNIKVQQSKDAGQVPDMVHLIVPRVSEGSISDHGAKALVSEISAALANRNAMLIVVPNIDLIPMSLRKALSKPIRIAPISKDVLLFGISVVHPTTTREAMQEIADILPSDLSLKAAEPYHILAAFRQPSAVAMAQSLNAMLTSALPQTGIEALRGSGELMLAAEQIVADLQAYGRGELQWKDIPRGLLLCGQPGTGKSFAASCIAVSAQVAFLATTSGQWQAAGHLGNMLKAMRDDFARARALAPSIIFIDEIDALGSRQSADLHGKSYRTQVITEFLSLVDGVDAAEGVMLIGATNHVEALDPALLRPGRLDRLIAVPLPDQETLEQLLRHHLQTDLPDLNLSGLAKMARGVARRSR